MHANRRVGLLLCLAAPLVGKAEWTNDFSVTFAEYELGEALSDKGATGGSWENEGEFVATNAVVGGRSGIDISGFEPGSRLEFVTTVSQKSNDIRRVDFAICPQMLSDGGGGVLDAAAGVAPGLLQNGEPGLFGFANGKWHEFAVPAGTVGANVWTDGRLELKTVDGVRYVSFLVRSAGEYVRLKDATGQDWFETRPEQPSPVIGYSGNGSFADFDGRNRTGDAERIFYWIGGTAGEWAVTNNWSLSVGGEPADAWPSAAGDVAKIAGTVSLTYASQTVPVRDLVATVGEGGALSVIGGSILPELSLDVSRPRAGKQLVALADDFSFLGRKPTYEYVWRRGDPMGSAFATVSTAAAFTPSKADYEHWFTFAAKDGEETVYTNGFYFSKLPVVYLTYVGNEPPGTDTSGGKTTQKKEYEGTVRVQGNDEWKAQYGYDGKDAMVIKARGNSTLGLPKKAYKIKLDKKTDMFKFGKNKHWVLLANYYDPANQRNKLAYDLANGIGSLGMDSTWVVCTLNGEYIGVYQFGEHIRPDENRVPIGNWEDVAEEEGGTAEDLSIIDPAKYDIETDYLLEFSDEMDEVTCFTTKAGKLSMGTMVNSPGYLKTNAAMYDWVKGFMQDYWDACVAADRKCKGKHYSEYSDMKSMTTFTLVNELFTNHDGCKKSRYAYIKDGKIIWGPVWDFDWGTYSISVAVDDYDRWVTLGDGKKEEGGAQRSAAEKRSMMKEWFSDFYFCREFYKKYWAVRDRMGRMVSEDIDKNYAYLAEALVADDARWSRKRTAKEDTATLKDHLTRRLQWLDGQIATVTGLVENVKRDIQTVKSTWDPNAKTEPTGSVPAMEAEVIRAALEPADPKLAWASTAELAVASTNVPSAWGKATPYWHDYVAGTNPDPNGTNAEFVVTSFAVTNGVPYIKWTPDLGGKRNYSLLYCEDIAQPVWHGEQEKTADDRFFKVEVSMP